MNALAMLLFDDAGGQIQQIALTFGVDWPHLIAQIISFSIVCLLLHRFAYRPILAMLEERRRQIEQGLADTEKIRAELARTETQRADVMIHANAEATKLIEEAHIAAARVERHEIQKAIASAEQIVVKSREAAAQEHDRMLAELKSDVGRLVLQATTRVTGRILTAEDQHRLAEETAKGMAA